MRVMSDEHKLRVAFVEEYIPSYRVDFFNLLYQSLSERNMILEVFYSAPDRNQALRNDAAKLKFGTHIQERSVTFFGRRIRYSATTKKLREFDLIILNPIGSSLRVNMLTILLRFSTYRLAFFGHIDSFTQKFNLLDKFVESWQLKRASMVFCYTRTGARNALSRGVLPENTLVVNNTFNTAQLNQQISDVTQRDVENFIRVNSLPSDGCIYFAYLGGIDASKKIEFLVKTLDYLWQIEASRHIRFLIFGNGADTWRLEESISRGQSFYFGSAGLAEKAIVGRLAIAICNPGRIGLLAVDALTLKIPILTATRQHHGPEFEYLSEGQSVFVSKEMSPRSYSDLMLNFKSLDKKEMNWPVAPDLKAMVATFVEGIEIVLRGSK